VKTTPPCGVENQSWNTTHLMELILLPRVKTRVKLYFRSWIYSTTRVKVTLFLGVKLTLKLPELKRLWIWSHSVTVDSTPFLELNLLLKIYCELTIFIWHDHFTIFVWQQRSVIRVHSIARSIVGKRTSIFKLNGKDFHSMFNLAIWQEVQAPNV
jgi:hypothetical protein